MKISHFYWDMNLSIQYVFSNDQTIQRFIRPQKKGNKKNLELFVTLESLPQKQPSFVQDDYNDKLALYQNGDYSTHR